MNSPACDLLVTSNNYTPYWGIALTDNIPPELDNVNCVVASIFSRNITAFLYKETSHE